MSAPLRLALRYDPPAETAAEGLPARILSHALAAERAGVALVWVSERPFAGGAPLPAALPLCAALAARTGRLRIGAGPLPLPVHHPVRVAEDAASLDGLSAGRVELGLGLGAHPGPFAAFGIPRRVRVERFEEAVAVIRAAWSGAPLSFAGRHHTVEGVTVHPRPHTAAGPPLWIGAGAEPAVRRAARLGTGLLAQSVDAVAVFARECAVRPLRIGLELRTSAPDEAAATIEAARTALAGRPAALDLVVPAFAPDGSLLPPEALAPLRVLVERDPA